MEQIGLGFGLEFKMFRGRFDFTYHLEVQVSREGVSWATAFQCHTYHWSRCIVEVKHGPVVGFDDIPKRHTAVCATSSSTHHIHTTIRFPLFGVELILSLGYFTLGV